MRSFSWSRMTLLSQEAESGCDSLFGWLSGIPGLRPWFALPPGSVFGNYDYCMCTPSRMSVCPYVYNVAGNIRYAAVMEMYTSSGSASGMQAQVCVT